MRKGTLLGLLVLFGGLVFLWLAKERTIAKGGPELGQYPLWPAFELERVRAVRIDHLERGFQLGFERDASGQWFMTDPLAYPAQGALVRMLLQSLSDARGVPAPEVQPSTVALDPPKVVLECVQVEDSGERTLRVELGEIDVDPALIYVRVPGHPSAAASGCDVFRTTRSIYTTLERNPDDYRERHVSTLRPEDVIAVRRSGQVRRTADGVLEDLAFDALTTGEGWKRAAPGSVSLDPNGMALLVRGACELSADHFTDDSPSDYAQFGLEPPAFSLELSALEGTSVAFDFGFPPGGPNAPLAEQRWFFRRRGFAHVFEARTRDVELLASPADLFFDQLVVRALRTDVVKLELEGGGERRVLERDKKGWSVRAAGHDEPAEGAAEGARSPGNPSAIDEAFGLLEKIQLPEHLPGEAFEPSSPPLGFKLTLKNGQLQGGAIGRATRDPKSGAQGRQFLRLGDEVVALIDASVVELCERPLDEFRSRKVHQVQESTVRAIELEHAGHTYTFVNSGENVWKPRGQEIQAPADFVQSLDVLLNLGAKRWLAAAPAHEAVLAVRILPTQGDPLAFTFGRTPDGATVCLEGEHAAEVDGALVERLLKLF